VPARGNLKDQIISISQDYLGPASERFIDRQASMHLNKNIEDLTQADLVKLVDWIRLSFALLTNDSRLVDEYIDRLVKISRSKIGNGYSR
jgi:ribosomal protein S13